MRYYGDIYRAPSEAESLLLQVMVGCSHNKCSFCYMYKDKSFRIRPLEEVKEDAREARSAYTDVRRVFLIDGNALILKTSYLSELLDYIGELFPECERVGLSATAEDILRKSPQDLKVLCDKGMKILYMGVESGSEEVLKRVQKGTTAARMIEAGQRVRAAGIKLSVSIITGLGGKASSASHAGDTAKVLNEINPDFIGLLTLLVHDKAPLKEEVENGTFQLLDGRESLDEIRELVKQLDVTNCVFRGNHASNYAPLKAFLPDEKQRLLDELELLISGTGQIKQDRYRRL
jgi:radical SAM superfamily enzyme YgiQ (UPF0313 family)